MQTYRVAGEVEAAPWRFVEAMTSRRFPAPWRADKIPGMSPGFRRARIARRCMKVPG